MTFRLGKRFIAANPWPLAAEAKRLGLPTDGFQESNFVADDKVYIVDLDALAELPPLNLLSANQSDRGE